MKTEPTGKDYLLVFLIVIFLAGFVVPELLPVSLLMLFVWLMWCGQQERWRR